MNDEEIKKRVDALFVNPDTTKRVVDIITNNKPDGWSRRSNATYYKECYAIQAKKVLDAMAADRKDRIYRYDVWKHMTPASVYLRVNQSMRFLTEHLDEDRTYTRLLETISVTRERNIGVKLTFLEEFRDKDTATFMPDSVIPAVEIPKWKEAMEDWLETSDVGDKPFVQTNLMLTADEIREIKLQFVGVTNIMASITSQAIKLVKINV
jgi:hypothetical protein